MISLWENDDIMGRMMGNMMGVEKEYYFYIIMFQGIKRENSFKVLDNGKKQV